MSQEESATVQTAIREYFHDRAGATRKQLRLLFRRGRTSLVIGLMFLAVSMVLGNIAEDLLRETRFAGVARESLLIGGWCGDVASARSLSLRLVADSGGGAFIRSTERDDRSCGAIAPSLTAAALVILRQPHLNRVEVIDE